MTSEHTPLLGRPHATATGRPRRSRQLSGCAIFVRWVMIGCGSMLLTAGLVLVVLSLLLAAPYGPGHASVIDTVKSGLHHNKAHSIPHHELQDILINTPSAERSEEWSRYYTDGPHLAGKNLSQAVWTRDKWQKWGLDSNIISYNVYINYPEDHGLVMYTKTTNKTAPTERWKVAYKASLEEDVIPEDPSTARPDRIPTFHGYSASGNVTGQFIYVNYGTYLDFEDLIKAGIDLEGKIALVRYGGIFRGLKVKRAQELGMIGVVMFTDPGDDGEVTKENGYEEYPIGPARNPSSVQRGSTQFLSIQPGDPTTPGYPSKPGAPRQPVDKAIPSIPSLPISFRDALPILKALNGHGPAASDFNSAWNRNLGLSYLGVKYNIGPSPQDTVLNLYNKQKYVTTPLWNVIGVINGTIPDEVVVIGNHRDAWIVGGAVDPNSGSAVLNEVIRSIGVARAAGWKPTRTIVFASWDGEEYGLIGSTEWVEEYLPWLHVTSVAYVNIDMGVGGPHFGASAAPLLHEILRNATASVASPNQTVPGQTVADVWDGRIETMGSGSDFTAFQDFAGVPSLDLSFRPDTHSAAYHYHSNYDSFDWEKNFGDPSFLYHRTMAQIAGVVVAQLTDLPVIQFNATQYADQLSLYLDSIESKFAATAPHSSIGLAHSLGLTDDDIHFVQRSVASGTSQATGSLEMFKPHFQQLRETLAELRGACVELDNDRAFVSNELAAHIPWWKFWRLARLVVVMRQTNYRYKTFERSFLYDKGLDGRSWFKHVVFAPGRWTGYSGAVFPGLVESIDDNNFANAVKWANIINDCLKKAVEGARATYVPRLDYSLFNVGSVL
ncbi:putative glutamate carboxypeptidase [Ceratocystis fimbriata CBS 114723]|uniref:Putative glutamate carboxypeptidase n=1 Tax=Ceratocystis fimbriata CBS 114723 TaxID=1035309 RepID=A0A2C5X1L4_9PEZI|nr:putative glutamate carboxypeptidase [Ceratocystis fimbriata CBS 114723]